MDVLKHAQSMGWRMTRDFRSFECVEQHCDFVAMVCLSVQVGGDVWCQCAMRSPAGRKKEACVTGGRVTAAGRIVSYRYSVYQQAFPYWSLFLPPVCYTNSVMYTFGEYL